MPQYTAETYDLQASAGPVVVGGRWSDRAENIQAFGERAELESMRRVTKTLALFIAGWKGGELLFLV